jgi:hypothetical protein
MEVASDDTRLEQVTVYSRGARVRRVTTITSTTIPQHLRIIGLPLAVIDDTVRVEVDGPAIATNVRAGVATPAAEIAAPEDAPELRGAKRRIALADAGIERITAALARLGASSIIAEDPSDDPPAAWGVIVAARRSVAALRAERELALRTNLAAARRELDEARRALEAVADRDHRSGTARPAKQHELRKFVEIELVATGPGAPVTIHLEYLVAAARWAPSYVARLEGERALVEIRAVVAQDTGEDWTRVPLRLSTAEPTRFAQLPELASQRIGRRQQEPVRAGFRAPPIGAEALYADYDRDVVPLRPPQGEKTISTTITDAYANAPVIIESADEPAVSRGLRQEVWDEESSAAKAAFSTPAGGMPMPMPPPAPAAKPAAARTMMTRLASSIAPVERAEKKLAAQAPVVLLDYANLVMAPPSSRVRGRLVTEPEGHRHEINSSVETGRARVIALPLPPGCAADWSHAYDYAFATDGAVDVRADGMWHSIAVTARPAAAKLHHVSVPREQADVFRIAAIANPFAGPLLPGPIDIYDRGRFLVTSTVEYSPPGAPLEIGLGVDAAVKIARNTEFSEEATGVLRGALRLHHAIAIEIENASGRPIDLEIRERIPVTRDGDDDIEVTIGAFDPKWERWTPEPDGPRARRLRGGYRWRFVMPAGQKRTLRAAYEVKIAGKSELVGGNRRES